MEKKVNASGIQKNLYERIGSLNLLECHKATLQWSQARGILENGKVVTQALKLGSELGELQDNVGKGRLIVDDIGDCLVVLSNLAHLSGLELASCWNHALNDIKDRQGFLNKQGNFIKSTDKNYQALLDLQDK